MIKILVVDDDKFEREGLIYLLNKLFEKLNHSHIEEFSIKDLRNGRLALEALERENFDIVITDIKMPVMDGMAFLERASKLRPNITYIIYSGFNDFENAKKAIHYNVMEFLVKPVNENEFNKILTEAINNLKLNIKKAMKTKLASLKYERNILENDLDFLHSLNGRLIYTIADTSNLEICNERLEKLNEENIAIDIGEKEKLIWLCGTCSKKDNIEDSLKYIFAGLDVIAIISRKILSLDLIDEEFVKISGFKEGLAVKDRFSILYARDYDNRKLFEMEENTSNIIENLLLYIKEKSFLSLDMKESMVNVIKDDEDSNKLLKKNILKASYIFEIEENLNNINIDSELIVKVKDYISKNYMKDILVDDIAGYVFLNSSYLCTVFKREVGTTIVNYITNYRLNKAMEFLERKDIKIADIAKKVGYNNISYFNSIFRQKIGLTPNQYRKRELEYEE